MFVQKYNFVARCLKVIYPVCTHFRLTTIMKQLFKSYKVRNQKYVKPEPFILVENSKERKVLYQKTQMLNFYYSDCSINVLQKFLLLLPKKEANSPS